MANHPNGGSGGGGMQLAPVVLSAGVNGAAAHAAAYTPIDGASAYDNFDIFRDHSARV